MVGSKSIEYVIEFNQFLSKIKTNYDQQPEKLDDRFIIISMVSMCSRFFYIADDRQFYLMKSYLLDLFKSDFKTQDEFYNLKVGKNIFALISNALTEKEYKALPNLFAKGSVMPFNSVPVLVFGEEAYENNNKPFMVYKFKINIENNTVKYNLKMPLFNPSKIFTPLALVYMLEYTYYNLEEPESFEISKKVMLDLLELIVDRKFSEIHVVNGVLIKNNLLL